MTLYVDHPEIEVLQVPSEFEPVLEIYRGRAPRRVLEIGSWQGGTLHHWLTEGSPDLVVAVDLEHQRPDLYEGWRKPGTRLEVITGDSLRVDTKEAMKALAPYDWLFVDGDHGEGACRSDVEQCIGNAAPNATLVIHDIALGCGIGDPGPRIVLEELRDRYVVREFVEDPYGGPWAHGLAVIDL